MVVYLCICHSAVALSVVNMRKYCQSHRIVNIFPYVFRGSIVLSFAPSESTMNPATNSDQRNQATRSEHDQRQVNSQNKTETADIGSNTPLSSTTVKTTNGGTNNYKEASNRDMNHLFSFGENIQLGKCKVQFKCTEEPCRQSVLLSSPHVNRLANSRKSLNLRILDDKISSYEDLLYRKHVRPRIGSADILRKEICVDENYCRSSSNFLTIAYDIPDNQWFEPFNVTLTLFKMERSATGSCPWSYILCRKTSMCIHRSLVCDGHSNCGVEDVTDEDSCADGSIDGVNTLTTPTPQTSDNDSDLNLVLTPASSTGLHLEDWLFDICLGLSFAVLIVASSFLIVKSMKRKGMKHFINPYASAVPVDLVSQYDFVRMTSDLPPLCVVYDPASDACFSPDPPPPYPHSISNDGRENGTTSFFTKRASKSTSLTHDSPHDYQQINLLQNSDVSQEG